jgi:hypothetical protein
MNRRVVAAAAIVLLLQVHASAHRLDEYLQAAIISVAKDRVQVSLRLVPGVAVFSRVLSSIDTNGDGVISESEKARYVERLFADLTLSVDGEALRPRLASVAFPEVREMQEGLGQIQIEFIADLPPGGPNRKLVLQNRHQSAIAAYLVNCLVPQDPDIRIVAQHRNEFQSFYQLDYVQQGPGWANRSFLKWWTGTRERLGAIAFTSLFRLGMRHISGGTDHLLFLLALLLPAPLLVFGSRWAGFAGVAHSLLRVLRVVTAFTVGHSITLLLAALGLVRVPGRTIEVLIAVSILVSAIHALRPLFPGREPVIAGSFGLIHGLAFASTLGQLGLSPSARVVNILAFNLGIEAMQLLVVAASLPSLLLWSRTRGYSVIRIGGALFAGCASLGWIAERLFDVHPFVSEVVEGIAHHAVGIAAALFLAGCCSLAAHCINQRTALETLPLESIREGP